MVSTAQVLGEDSITECSLKNSDKLLDAYGQFNSVLLHLKLCTMKKMNRKELRGILSSRAFALKQKQERGEKLTFGERNILNIELRKVKRLTK